MQKFALLLLSFDFDLINFEIVLQYYNTMIIRGEWYEKKVPPEFIIL